MSLKDLIITPFFLCIFIAMAYIIRPYVTNIQTKKYFLSALLVRFLGAILLGGIYQFYYEGGDTFNFWKHGSQYIWNAFQDDPIVGLKLIFGSGNDWNPDTYSYTSHIWYYKSPSSYMVVRITAFFDLLTFHTYSATALFFSVFSFSGIWALFSAVQKKYPTESPHLAITILFFPSVVFWGSGILKDTITLGALGWMTWALLEWIIFKNRKFNRVLVFIVSFWLIFKIKLYILLCFLPMIVLWLFLIEFKRIKGVVLKILIVPFLILLFGFSVFTLVERIAENDSKYKLENLSKSARITAYDIRYGWGSRLGGDGGYDIGLPDGTIEGTLSLAPAAINVSLFRPYIWEVSNPFMLLASMESLILLIVFTWLFVIKKGYLKLWNDPFLIFCLLFSLLFAYAVGVSTFNFGTLMRYKIPLLPFFWILVIVSRKKMEAADISI